jgi:hypothetical protein
MCGFRKLESIFIEDNYPLPKMDHILENVVGENKISIINGFFRYIIK